MTRQIFIGLMSEGKTDNRFLFSIVKRTFNEIGFECSGELEILVVPLRSNDAGEKFIDKVFNASKEGYNKFGIMILCVHTDADSESDETVLRYKIEPTKQHLITSNEPELCRIVVSIIPVQMIEAWMLADRDLFKKEIGSNMSDNALQINHHPERFSNPKGVISDAIRIARQSLTKRRRQDLTISDLYQPIGQKISIEKLDVLPSFQKFKSSIREAYRSLNFLQ